MAKGGPYCTKHSKLGAIRHLLRVNEGIEVKSSQEVLVIGRQIVTRKCVDCAKPFYVKRSSISTTCRACHSRRGQTRDRKVRGKEFTSGFIADLRAQGKIYCFGCQLVKQKPDRKLYSNHCKECYDSKIKPRYALHNIERLKRKKAKKAES